MARLTRATYALFVALLPAVAVVIGVVVLQQLPSLVDLAGIALVMAGVVLHRETAPRGLEGVFDPLQALGAHGDDVEPEARARRAPAGLRATPPRRAARAAASPR